MVAHACNYSTWEMEGQSSQPSLATQRILGLDSMRSCIHLLSPKIKRKKGFFVVLEFFFFSTLMFFFLLFYFLKILLQSKTKINN